METIETSENITHCSWAFYNLSVIIPKIKEHNLSYVGIDYRYYCHLLK